MKFLIYLCPSKCSDTSAKCLLKSKCPGTRHALSACAESSSLPRAQCLQLLISHEENQDNSVCEPVQIPLCLYYNLCVY